MFLNGIEYNEFPPPSRLIKVMSKEFALRLVEEGELRIWNLEFFRKWENRTLGDINDGNSLFHLNGHRITVGSINDVYAYCFSHLKISDRQINLNARSQGYDCVVTVNNPIIFFGKINAWLVSNRPGFRIHCGDVNYTRGDELSKADLNSQNFHYNIFQKSKCFLEDKEYRLSITNSTFKKLNDQYIDLDIGNCAGLLSIKSLLKEKATNNY